MSLDDARKNLKQRLESGKAFDSGEEGETLRLMEVWWDLFKKWEQNDRFLTAFREGRMSCRQCDETGHYGVYEGVKGIENFAVKHVTTSPQTQPYPEERYRIGRDALKERLDPVNLDGGQRLKYKKGLHDLSASLLTPKIPKLTDQVRWKDDSQKDSKLLTWCTVFMPLPEPGDMAVFDLLNTLGKQARLTQPKVYEKVVWMRHRMTRLKLADSVDIGAGLRDVATGNPLGKDYKPNFKYGMKGFLGEDGKLTGIDATRHQKALNYPSILPTDQQIAEKQKRMMELENKDAINTNEIVISYRAHEGVRFPLFTMWDAKEKAFVGLKQEEGSKWVKDGKIPNEWALTVEA